MVSSKYWLKMEYYQQLFFCFFYNLMQQKAASKMETLQPFYSAYLLDCDW